VEEIIKVITKSVGGSVEGSENLALSLVNRLLENTAQETRTALLTLPISNGEELHTFADAIELALLEHKQGA
jgi:hypothetical protein